MKESATLKVPAYFKIAFIFTTFLLTVLSTTKAQRFEAIYSNYPLAQPRAKLIQSTDGSFYGSTEYGGHHDMGTVFKMNNDDSITVLHHFSGADGKNPQSSLTLGKDGAFYGTTYSGGVKDRGTIFRITASGQYRLLHSFIGTDGAFPVAELAEGRDGAFYGTTSSGGKHMAGTVFKITANGKHQLLKSFNGVDGSMPSSGLVQDSNGILYGTTCYGGASYSGTVYRITTSGAHRILHNFSDSNGICPKAGLVWGNDGFYYGTTREGGVASSTGKTSYGTIFRITPSGTHSLLYSFNDVTGSYPSGSLILANDGSFYGTTERSDGNNGNGTVFKITPGRLHTLLHSFDETDGKHPTGELIVGTDGAFYGTTRLGGTRSYGTIFKINSLGEHTVISNFATSLGIDPYGGLHQAQDGAFYGTTRLGGVNNLGTVFKVNASGEYTLLHSFLGNDGSNPRASLIQATDGNFYGTAAYGGNNNNGTIFRINATGDFSVLHFFDGENGKSPFSRLTQGSDGDLYGTTYLGGVWNKGTVFKVNLNGTFTLLYSFHSTDGKHPVAGLIQGSDGNFYGSTFAGGSFSSVPSTDFPKDGGTIFRISPQGLHTVLHSFEYDFSPEGFGALPDRELVESKDGYFYGTTREGGIAFNGTVFKVSHEGDFTLIRRLSGFAMSGLKLDDNGDIFGIHNLLYRFNVVYKISRDDKLTRLHEFDYRQNNNFYGTPIFGEDGHLYGASAPFTIWRIAFGSPQLVIRSSQIQIPNNIVVTRPPDPIYIGGAIAGGGSAERKFTLENRGTASLSLTGSPIVSISGSSAFKVSRQPSHHTVPANESETFEIQFIPDSLGLHTAVVSISHDELAQNPFTFAIAGIGGKPENKKPNLRLATPAAKTVSALTPLTVAGVANDDFAINRVELVLNGGATLTADLNLTGKSSTAPFTAQITPRIGENTLVVTAYDPSGNSTSITRVFTFEQRYQLTLSPSVPASSQANPDNVGSVALRPANSKNATTLTKDSPQTSHVVPETMLTLAATAKNGHLFSHWNGLPQGAQVRGNVAAFMMPAADTSVTAVFVENPLTQGTMAALGAKPVFQGLLRPDETTSQGNDTAGFLSAAIVPAKGSLSGKLWMDGIVTSFTGVLHGDGSVWLKVGRDLAAALPFAGRELTMTWSESGLATSVTCTVNEVTHVSTGLAKAPRYSRAAPVRGALLDAKGRQGYFTLALPTVTQDPVKQPTEYPQGSGHAGLTLLANGTLKLAGTLAEGTKITAASFLVEDDAAEVFVVLPTPGGKTKAGSLLGTLVFDEAQPDTDVTSADMQWFRPVAQTRMTSAQAYRAGWPSGIKLGTVGALYQGTLPVQTALGLAMTGPSGNAELVFQDGKLIGEVNVPLNLDGSRVMKLDAKDKTWSLVLSPRTGLMTGVFAPDWTDAAKRLPSFSGILLQKGGIAGGHGFFLSNRAGDSEPESGSVSLE